MHCVKLVRGGCQLATVVCRNASALKLWRFDHMRTKTGIPRVLPLAALCVLLVAPTVSHAQPANAVEIQIKADQVASHVSPLLYGLMTEEINYSYDGGLYAELVRNRNFKEDAKDAVHWQLVQENGGAGSMSLDSRRLFNEALPASAELTGTHARGDQSE